MISQILKKKQRNYTEFVGLLSMLLLIAGCTSSSVQQKQPSIDQTTQQQTTVKDIKYPPKVNPVVIPEEVLPPISQEMLNPVGDTQFDMWLTQYPFREPTVIEYAEFLRREAGFLPPMNQMLRSARSWKKCGFEPYEVPPREQWYSMIDTLKLLKKLQQDQYMPLDIRIVSVYRNPELNRCANGSRGSKHLLNAALDIKVDYADQFERDNVERGLCSFWNEQGHLYNFGLGLYKSGTIHIDTQGHRRWGSSYGSRSSPCNRLGL